jgi:hypothetical protein
MWMLRRRWYPEGQDKDVDAFLADLRISLDELNEVLGEEIPEYFDLHDAIDDVVYEHDEQVADTIAMLDDLDIGQNRRDTGDEVDITQPVNQLCNTQVRKFST